MEQLLYVQREQLTTIYRELESQINSLSIQLDNIILSSNPPGQDYFDLLDSYIDLQAKRNEIYSYLNINMNGKYSHHKTNN